MYKETRIVLPHSRNKSLLNRRALSKSRWRPAACRSTRSSSSRTSSAGNRSTRSNRRTSNTLSAARSTHCSTRSRRSTGGCSCRTRSPTSRRRAPGSARSSSRTSSPSMTRWSFLLAVREFFSQTVSLLENFASLFLKEVEIATVKRLCR